MLNKKQQTTLLADLRNSVAIHYTALAGSRTYEGQKGVVKQNEHVRDKRAWSGKQTCAGQKGVAKEKWGVAFEKHKQEILDEISTYKSIYFGKDNPYFQVWHPLL